MSLRQSRRYLGGGLLLLTLCCSACTGISGSAEPVRFPTGPTEADPVYPPPEAASRYRQPRMVTDLYDYDKTEVDLARERK